MENAIFTVSIKSAQLPEFIALATSENLETLNMILYIFSSLTYPLSDTTYQWHIISVSKEELSNFLDSLYDESLGLIVRCKGILKAKDNEKWYYFDYVSGEVEIRLGEPDYTGRIVVIGSKINKEKISSMFKNI